MSLSVHSLSVKSTNHMKIDCFQSAVYLSFFLFDLALVCFMADVAVGSVGCCCLVSGVQFITCNAQPLETACNPHLSRPGQQSQHPSNQGTVFRSRDLSGPIAGQYSDHVTRSELASVRSIPINWQVRPGEKSKVSTN